MEEKRKKQKVGIGKQVHVSGTPANEKEKNGSKRVKELKTATSDPPVPLPSTGNGSEKPKKKKKRKSESSQSEEAQALPAAPRPYDAIGREAWRVKLDRKQVVKVSAIQNIAAGVEHRLLTGKEVHGKISTGDSDGVWANLIDAQRFICGMAAVLSEHLADNTIVPKDCLTEARWATPLNDFMEAAAQSALGHGGDAMVMDVKFSVRRVCVINEEYDHYGESHLATLIDVYADCMGTVSSLWLELCELVHSKFAQVAYDQLVELVNDATALQRNNYMPPREAERVRKVAFAISHDRTGRGAGVQAGSLWTLVQMLADNEGRRAQTLRELGNTLGPGRCGSGREVVLHVLELATFAFRLILGQA